SPCARTSTPQELKIEGGGTTSGDRVYVTPPATITTPSHQQDKSDHHDPAIFSDWQTANSRDDQRDGQDQVKISPPPANVDYQNVVIAASQAAAPAPCVAGKEGGEAAGGPHHHDDHRSKPHGTTATSFATAESAGGGPRAGPPQTNNLPVVVAKPIRPAQQHVLTLEDRNPPTARMKKENMLIIRNLGKNALPASQLPWKPRSSPREAPRPEADPFGKPATKDAAAAATAPHDTSKNMIAAGAAPVVVSSTGPAAAQTSTATPLVPIHPANASHGVQILSRADTNSSRATPNHLRTSSCNYATTTTLLGTSTSSVRPNAPPPSLDTSSGNKKKKREEKMDDAQKLAEREAMMQYLREMMGEEDINDLVPLMAEEQRTCNDTDAVGGCTDTNSERTTTTRRQLSPKDDLHDGPYGRAEFILQPGEQVGRDELHETQQTGPYSLSFPNFYHHDPLQGFFDTEPAPAHNPALLGGDQRIGLVEPQQHAGQGQGQHHQPQFLHHHPQTQVEQEPNSCKTPPAARRPIAPLNRSPSSSSEANRSQRSSMAGIVAGGAGGGASTSTSTPEQYYGKILEEDDLFYSDGTGGVVADVFG
ncbi:unnamed protein product, partial [Amoebophrya sp. A120]